MFHKITTLISSLSRKPRQMKRESGPALVAPRSLDEALNASLAAGDYRRIKYTW
jgi:hypothetical protein